MPEQLSFPDIGPEQLPPSIRSVDEIDEWIQQDYEAFFDREAYEKQKQELSVNVPFRL